MPVKMGRDYNLQLPLPVPAAWPPSLQVFQVSVSHAGWCGLSAVLCSLASLSLFDRLCQSGAG